MKTLINIVFLALYTQIMLAQSLTGSIRDQNSGSPVAYATVALLRQDSTIVTGVTSNDEGHFVLEKLPSGDYILQVSFIGYQKVFRAVNVPEQSDLGEIGLSESVNTLKEVVVEGRRALIEQKLDRIVVNVAGNMITAGSNVQDLLKQMPGLIVDEQGNVSLNGRPATVYIDGRPTRLPKEQVANMIRGMQGDMVDRVELIGNPSSRYEASMSSAIVNIRLKRDVSLGVNGTVTAGIGFTDNGFVKRGGLNLNYRSKKINVFGNYSYYGSPTQTEIYQKRNFDDIKPVTYDQNSCARYTGPDQTLRAGVDYFIDTKQTLGFLFNGTYSNSDGTFKSDAAISPAGSAKIDSTVHSDSRLTEKSNSQMYNLNYKLGTGKGEELNVDADYGRVYGNNWQDMRSIYTDAAGNAQRLPSEFQYMGPRNIDIFSLKADYTKSLSEKATVEGGLKTGQTVTDNNIIYENLDQNRWVTDYNQTNRFKYTEKVSAAYATYSHKFGKLSAMAGLRAEYTAIKGESPTMDTAFSRSYLDLFPSGYLQYQFNDNNALNLSYSRKITRPSYGQLNPFRTYADRFTYESGNPDLNPSYSHTVELSYNGFLTTSYNVRNDVFDQVFVQDDATHTTAIVRNNIGKRQSWDVSAYFPLQLKKYALVVITQAGWNMEDSRYNGQQFKKEYWSAYLQLQHHIQILPTLRLNIQMMGFSGGWQGTTRFDGFWDADAQLEKTFFDRRLSFVLACTDIFNSHNISGKVNFGNIDQTIKMNNNYRRTVFTVRFKFGSQKIKGARSRDVGIEDEISRTKKD